MKSQVLTANSITRPSSDRANRWSALQRGIVASTPPEKVAPSSADPQRVEVKRSEPRTTLSELDLLLLDLP